MNPSDVSSRKCWKDVWCPALKTRKSVAHKRKRKLLNNKLKIGGLFNDLSHWVRLVFTLGNCRCGGVGWDSGCEHEGSHLMHDTEHFI